MGMEAGGQKGGVKARPNVVPMIDIMLVLLIIFMIVTPIISSGFQAEMPQAKNIEARPEEEGDVVLGIDVNGNFFLDPGTGEISPVKAGDLEQFLTDVYGTRLNKILYFRADAQLDFQRVEDAIQIARKAGVRLLAAVTEEERGTATFGGGG